jgi:hypothetical protein
VSSLNSRIIVENNDPQEMLLIKISDCLSVGAGDGGNDAAFG